MFGPVTVYDTVRSCDGVRQPFGHVTLYDNRSDDLIQCGSFVFPRSNQVREPRARRHRP